MDVKILRKLESAVCLGRRSLVVLVPARFLLQALLGPPLLGLAEGSDP